VESVRGGDGWSLSGEVRGIGRVYWVMGGVYWERCLVVGGVCQGKCLGDGRSRSGEE